MIQILIKELQNFKLKLNSYVKNQPTKKRLLGKTKLMRFY